MTVQSVVDSYGIDDDDDESHEAVTRFEMSKSAQWTNALPLVAEAGEGTDEWMMGRKRKVEAVNV